MKVVIVEDNVETLGVLRDFVRAIDPGYEITTLSSGSPLLEQSGRLQADLLILGYDLGPSVTGTELLHYLEWSDRISAKTQVVFISNTIELAKRQAPLRFTHTQFYEKPISLGHLESIFARVKENQVVFSSVFYLIDKKKWLAAFNSLQLCKENCPTELQHQAWLLECQLLLSLRRYAKVIRRYELVQDYEWAKVVRLKALVSLGQIKLARHVFNGMAVHDAYYSSALALINQLQIISGDENGSFLPATLKEAELSLFEYEFKATLSVVEGNSDQGFSLLINKQRRAKRASYQSYFFAMSVLKIGFIHLLKEPSPQSVQSALPHMQSALDLLQNSGSVRDKVLNDELWPALIEAMENATLTAEQQTTLLTGPVTEDQSPISLLLRIYLHWLKTGELFLNQLESCIDLIERQGATSRAVCNQLLLEQMLDLMITDPKQRVRLHDAIAKCLLKAGKHELAAFAFARALDFLPEHQGLQSNMQRCLAKLEVKQFLSFSAVATKKC
ncbi:MAG: response regulator [Idiomarina sp.]|nr:response regulator [Idiomarina sp.]